MPIRLRADFDWTGLRIADQFLDPKNDAVSLWRMTARDYRSCGATQPLTGTPYEPDWAHEISTAMRKSGLAAYEEELIDTLIADLDDRSR